MRFRSILVPLDGSQFGEHALPYALSLARRAGARLELAHVHVPQSIFSLPDSHVPSPPDEDKGGPLAYLDEVTRRVKAASPSVEVTSTLLEGMVADALCKLIGRSDPDLVVLTTHGRGPLSRFWIGSVATDLVSRAPAPVLLVRPKEGPADLAADLAPRSILIPLDGSPFAEQIIPLAAGIGRLANAKYRLLRVVPPVLTSSTNLEMGGFGIESRTVADQLQADAQVYLASLTASIPDFIAAPTHISVDWPAAGAILADAEKNGIDLIALETHGRSGVARLFLGSVADKVVRGSTVPVLLRRPEQ